LSRAHCAAGAIPTYAVVPDSLKSERGLLTGHMQLLMCGACICAAT
jgi:hypothetical protein